MDPSKFKIGKEIDKDKLEVDKYYYLNSNGKLIIAPIWSTSKGVNSPITKETGDYHRQTINSVLQFKKHVDNSYRFLIPNNSPYIDGYFIIGGEQFKSIDIFEATKKNTGGKRKTRRSKKSRKTRKSRR